jgi:hypothetical protein
MLRELVSIKSITPAYRPPDRAIRAPSPTSHIPQAMHWLKRGKVARSEGLTGGNLSAA